jgi:hypothetical protein
MQDRQLYAQILGIQAPWFVERVELDIEGEAVRVYLAHEEAANWSCPECGRACALYDHQRERTWRHLDTCQYQTTATKTEWIATARIGRCANFMPDLTCRRSTTPNRDMRPLGIE